MLVAFVTLLVSGASQSMNIMLASVTSAVIEKIAQGHRRSSPLFKLAEAVYFAVWRCCRHCGRARYPILIRLLAAPRMPGSSAMMVSWKLQNLCFGTVPATRPWQAVRKPALRVMTEMKVKIAQSVPIRNILMTMVYVHNKTLM